MNDRDYLNDLLNYIDEIFADFHKHSKLTPEQRCPHSCPLTKLCDLMADHDIYPCEFRIRLKESNKK